MSQEIMNEVDALDAIDALLADELLESGAAGDDLDELLDELAAEEETAGVAKVEPELAQEELDEIALESALSSLEIEVAKDAAYAAQEAAAEVAAKTGKIITPETAPDAVEKKKKADKPKEPRVNAGSTANMKKSDAIRHKLGDACYQICVLDTQMAKMNDADLKVAIDQVIADVDTLPKKVGEKVLNLLCAINGKDNLSVYTKIAIELLKEKGPEGMTTADLRQKYLDRPYSPGTSSAQSSQMFQLLPFLGIAKRSGNTMILNEESVFADMF